MCERTLNIAHRGARSLAPENTLAAARKALEIGADMWELDVAMTADGVPFVVHDDTLVRTSNVKAVFPDRSPWANHLFTWAEVQQLDFGSWFVETDPFKQIAAGKVTQAELASYRGEKAPSLREALIFTRDHDWRVNVELKDLSGTPGDAGVVEAVVAMINELGMADRVLISSFNHRYIERVKQADPRIATAALVERADPDPVALLKRLNAQAYNPRNGQIAPAEIGRIRDAGFDVYIWTVNDETTMQKLIAARASGIFTDFPQLLKPLVAGCK
ncbi:MAG: glycerophosphodiester phosphodiesterase [Anaerolineae bacterium]